MSNATPSPESDEPPAGTGDEAAERPRDLPLSTGPTGDPDLRIGPWTFQPGARRLLGPQGTVPLSRDAAAALRHLAARPGELVSRDEMAALLWGNQAGGEGPGGGQGGGGRQLTRCIHRLRLALNDTTSEPSYIETVPRLGYRLIRSVKSSSGETLRPERYRRIEQIGDGGMGVVYKAEDTRLRRMVALKFLPAAWSRDGLAKERFMMEARSAAALDHPNICTLHEVAETDDGQLFFVMAYYEGQTVKERLRSGALPWREAVEVARQVAVGLAAAHQRSIVHRDIKPANIMITRSGEVKILDFGVAKSAGASRLTRTGTAIGTPTHMSPEQVMGRDVDHRTDLWSLGVVLYEMLSGRLPFRGDVDHAVLYQIVNAEPQPLETPENAPPALTWLLDRALAKDPDLRYADAEEMAADLAGISEGTLPGTDPLPAGLRAPGGAAGAVSGARLASRTGSIAGPNTRFSGGASIAVLPFADLSPERNQEYFCDGMAEELIGALARVERIRVVSRTSAFQLKGSREDVRTLGRRLGVGAVLTGSVRKAGSRLRINVELVDTSNAFQLWAERFDRELEDVFAVQDEIAKTVAETLKAKLLAPGEKAVDQTTLVKAQTDDLQAYQLYLRGRHYWAKRTEEGLKKSVGCFRQAIGRDSSYAQAYAGLADAYVTVGFYGALPPEQVMPAARMAAVQALELDPDQAEAHAALACVQSLYEWAWQEAEGSFRRALQLDPLYATAHGWYAMNLLVPLGRFDDAVAELEKALVIDPLALAINASLGVAAYFAGRYADAEAAYRRTLELEEAFPMAHYFLAQTLTELERHDEAVAEAETACELAGGGSPEMRAALAVAHARAGHRERALAVLEDIRAIARQRYVSPALTAQVHAGLGDAPRALADLEEAYRIQAADLAWIGVRPVFDDLREEPRLDLLLAKMGLREDSSTAGRTLVDWPQL